MASPRTSLSTSTRFRLIGALLLLSSAAAVVSHEKSHTRDQLLAIEAAWNDAIRSKNVAFLNELLVPEFELIFSPDKVIGKADVIRNAAGRSWEITANGCRSQNVRLYGDAAVITGTYFEDGQTKDQSYHLEARYTDVYVRKHGRWYAVSAHSSPGKPVFKALPQPSGGE